MSPSHLISIKFSYTPREKVTTNTFLIKCKAFIKIAAYLTVSSGSLAALSQLSTAPLRDNMCVKDYPPSNHAAAHPMAFCHRCHWPVVLYTGLFYKVFYKALIYKIQFLLLCTCRVTRLMNMLCIFYKECDWKHTI